MLRNYCVEDVLTRHNLWEMILVWLPTGIASNVCVELNRPPDGRTAGMFLSAAECLLLRLPSIRARSLGLRSIGEGTRRLTGDGPSTEAAEEATGGKSSSNDKLQILNYKL